MRAVSINEAEIILEPFWDGGTSDFEDKDKRYCVLDEYEISTANGTMATLTQGWAFAVFQIDKSCASNPTIVMSRSCDISLSGYDSFIVFGSFPKNTQIRVLGTIDGNTAEIILKTSGCGESCEYTGSFVGNKLTHLTLELYSDGIAQGNISWFGAANKALVANMLSRKSPYTAQWQGFFEENVQEFAPQASLLFSKEDLPQLREKLGSKSFKIAFDAKRKDAQLAMTIEPEKYIGRFIPSVDKRWNRSRDKNIGNVPQMMENLAFVGLIDNNAQMLKMACRYLISICHCEYWCESMVGVFPGATWHHRSFSESLYAKSAALVLDWAGALLTPFAKQLVYDAIVMKALPRIESDFHRIEYIRHMNQGIVFSNGRIFALLALIQRYPRYENLLAQAQADAIEMIDNYVQSDGGTLEGPGYWMFTFGEIMSAFYALCRKKNVPLTHYKSIFQKTGAFALGLMSMQDDGTEVLAINDAHPATHMSCSLAYCFYELTNDVRWKIIYETLLLKSRIDADTFGLICVPKCEKLCADNSPVPPAIFSVTGQFGSVRQGADLQTHLHYCSGLSYRGHYHQDKGSVIIEANGACLVPDFGTGYYHNSDLYTLTDPSSHSLLLPLYNDGRTAHQHANEPHGKVLLAQANQNFAHFYTDETDAWADEPYKFIRRRVLSPFAELVLLADEYCLANAHGAAFVLNGNAPYIIHEQQAVMCHGDVTLSVLPLNWHWDSAHAVQLLDGEHRTAYQLVANAQSAKSGFLITAICLTKNLPLVFEKSIKGFTITHGAALYEIEINEETKTIIAKEQH